MPTYEKLGCFGHCEDIGSGIPAPANGDYTVNTTFNGQRISLTGTYTTGEEITITGGELPENYTYFANITDSAGAILAGSYIEFTYQIGI